jgi:uncharacterized protein (DUF433 family)
MPEHPLIASSPDILGGTAVVRGTQISVRFLRALHARGASEAELLEDFPSLTAETLREVLGLAEETIAALENRLNDPLMPAIVRGAEVKAALARRARIVSAADYAALLGAAADDVQTADAAGQLLGVPWGDRRGYPAVFVRDGCLPGGLPDALAALRRTTASEWAILEALLLPWPDGSNLLTRLWNEPPETVVREIYRWAGTSDACDG